MNQTQKRILSILAAAAMTVCAVPQSAPLAVLQPVLTASAETDGDYAYEDDADGTGVKITKYTGSDAVVTIPASLGGKPVTVIGGSAFFQCESLTSVTIPDTVTVIENSAFNGCTALSSINLPASLKTIEHSAFVSCQSLTEIEIPDGVTSIGDGAFSSCSELAVINVPESVTSFGEAVFRKTKWLTLQQEQSEDSLVIVNHILLDGTAASGEVTVPNGVTCIGGQAFNMCKALTGITIPNSVKRIDKDAFYACTGLTEIEIPDSVTDIGYEAFKGSGLTEIVIPDSVTAIGGSAFMECTSLVSAALPDSLSGISNSMFRSCTALSDITIPNSVKEIADYAFLGCSSLTEAVIPEGVESIGFYSFAVCSNLTRVTVPCSVTSINSQAFMACPNVVICAYPGSYAETYAAQFGKTYEALDAAFSGVSLTLQDDLGLNFCVKGVTADNAADYAVKFVGECEETGQYIALTEKNAGKFCATANVSADHMGEEITAYLCKKADGNWQTIETVTYSVNKYLENAKPEADWTPDRQKCFTELRDTVKLYGEVSYAYFNTPDSMPDVVSYFTVSDLEGPGYGANFTSNNATISLVLDSKTAARLYISDLTVGAEAENGKKAIEGKNGRACFEFTGITPLKYETQLELTYNGKTYRFTPLSWCCRAKNLYGGAPKNPVMANALIEYWWAAKEYNETLS